ncbi:MAG: rhodanese-like domain-containing protein [Syntrophobacteraceae bacterium]
MIETFFGLGTLDSSKALVASAAIGFLFGFSLEKAGFGSSRRLAGIFYFRDMAVLKVMFSALITAMLGLLYFRHLGWIGSDQLFFMPTVYGAQIAGGLLFGIGFAMGGWCPGTAAVGTASGKLDALVFLSGTVLGSILFNESFPLVRPLYTLGDSGVKFVYESLRISEAAFAFFFTLIAVLCFWGAEYVERSGSTDSGYLNSPFLKSFSLALLLLAGGLALLPGSTPELAAYSRQESRGQAVPEAEARLLSAIERGEDHIDPESLANRIMASDATLHLVDIRTAEEFDRFHIRGAVNVPLSRLEEHLRPYRNNGTIVLYSNGMTHPAQARDALSRMGYENVLILTDGLKGFLEVCLKPVSLRSEPVPDSLAASIGAWRSYFAGAEHSMPRDQVRAVSETGSERTSNGLPGLVETGWLAENLDRVRVIDVRSQPEYNTGHIPGSIFISPDSLRGVVRGLPSMLLPSEMLAMHFSNLGLMPGDMAVIVHGEKIIDATLVGMAFERLGHKRYGILNGGFARWAAENRRVDTVLPSITATKYPVNPKTDDFTVDAQRVLRFVKEGGATILDVRPSDFFTGRKSDEARAGHIPGAVNRPFSEDIAKDGDAPVFKPLNDLAAAYAALIPSKDATVVVHCRTGHQASQTFFVLRNLLGYRSVLYYDAGWTEWAARPELPIAAGEK